MNKIYAFIIILPIIAMLFFKTISLYEFDTKQRYIKNTVDTVAHKVMLTGVFTDEDKVVLITKLNKLGIFNEKNIVLQCSPINADGSITMLDSYSTGDIIDRGEVFSIIVQSEEESLLSKMEGNADDDKHKLYYKAKAVCRVEKKWDSE